MYKYIGRGPVVRISRFQVTIPCYYCHYQSPESSVQSPESREHNIDIYSSAVNARVRTPATEIASSFSHFAIWHFAFCIVSVCLCVRKGKKRSNHQLVPGTTIMAKCLF